MRRSWSAGGRRVATAAAVGLALVAVLAPLPGPAAGATVPTTRLLTYSWSHTARLATFTFDAPGAADAAFECSLTGPSAASSWTSCTSPRQYSALDAGVYEFRVRARAVSGEVDPTPEERLFNIGIDQVRPDTTFSGIDAATTNRAAAFRFASTEAGTFECRRRHSGRLLGDWAPCTSPVTLAALPDGSHQFEARAVDTAGEYDRTPASHTWLVDATAPDTSISPGALEGRAASFMFAGGNTHQCRLVGPARDGGWTTCHSPQKYDGLADGRYEFSVRALDHHGNADPTPASHAWRVSTTLRLVARPKALGDPRPGRTLRATAGRWSPAPTRTRFQWLRDGRIIRSATGRAYRVRAVDRGHRLAVRVAVSRPDYRKATAVSTARRVR